MSSVKKFIDIGKEDAAIAGGKGASLGEMTQAGLPVPPGFVVVADAFDRFIEGAGLDQAIKEALAGVDINESASIDRVSASIRQLILEAAMPEGIKAEIEAEFKKLGAELVAVRSSATAEDSSAASWAGELETYLNVTAENLIESVKLCWSSLFTPRAIFYRIEKGLADHHVSVAVVVQKMIQSEVSGIAFTVHPVTEDYDRMIIEAGYGLGEAIVGGMITPDSYVVTKNDLNIEDTYVASQEMMIVRSPEGTSEQAVPAERQELQKLADGKIAELARICLNIEKHYGFPCDIEWAFEGGELYITQSRPITTLSKGVPAKSEIATLEKVYSREHSLFYIHVWNHSDVSAYDVRNSLFLKEKGSDVVSVWYHQAELDSLLQRIARQLNTDKKYLSQIKRAFKKYLVMLRPYLLKQKEVGSIAELKEYYKHLTKWWSAMAIVAAVPDTAELDEAIRAELLAMRTETQEYTDEADNVFINYFSRSFPEYREAMLLMTPKEIFSLEKRKLTDKELAKIQNRGKGYALLNGKLIVADKLASSLAANGQALSSVTSEGNRESIAGSVAFPGVVQGVVRVVLSKSQVGEVKEGEIIVAAMTTPEYMPALKRAAAFVTDEGGITCHAAIVARELQKPCVIGTKIATSVLKNGDLVEVDAEKGVVKILASGALPVDMISQTPVDIRSELKLYVLSKHISYQFIPVVCFESSSKCYVNNPYLKRFGAGGSQNFISFLDVSYEAWGDWSKRFLIRTPELAREILEECHGFLESHRERIEGLVAQDYEALSAAEIYRALKELDAIITDLYHLYIFFIDECFEVGDGSLNERLPEVRMKLSACAGRLYEGCDKVIEALSRFYPAIPWKAFTYAMVEEIGQLVNDPEKYAPVFATLENRPITFVALDDQLRVFFGQDALELKRFIQERNASADSVRKSQQERKFSGISAHKGQVTGAVVKVLASDYQRAAEVIGNKKGYVLVIPMTRPEIVPIIKDAAAIVTDEGGITCHAAIVARELQKPCIVGTKVATSVLKDGDLVKVDAEKGTVTILTASTLPAGNGNGLNIGNLGDYQRLFQWKGGGLPFLISDVFMGHYKTLQCLIVSAGGVWTNFLPKNIIEETLEDGLARISSTEKFEEYIDDFNDYKFRCTHFFKEVIKKQEISREELKEAMALLTELFFHYSKTEFFYIDRAFELAKDNATIRISLERFDEIKNGGRAFLNGLFFGSESHFEKMLGVLERKFEVSSDDLKCYGGEEIAKLFDNETVSKDVLAERRMAYVMQATGEKISVIQGEMAAEVANDFLHDAKGKNVNELKGVIANKGKVKGKVKVFDSDYGNFHGISEQIDKMKNGTILVADTTAPEMIVACKKASAILTNQGGLMSHAAIVSREMGIPCIVGLGNITEVVVDGDSVEVDADNGIVKLLRK